MTRKEAIEEIRSDYIIKKMCGNDYSDSFKEAIKVLASSAKGNMNNCIPVEERLPEDRRRMNREEAENLLDEYIDKHETMMEYIRRDDCIVWTPAAEYNAMSEYTLLREKLIELICG